MWRQRTHGFLWGVWPIYGQCNRYDVCLSHNQEKRTARTLPRGEESRRPPCCWLLREGISPSTRRQALAWCYNSTQPSKREKSTLKRRRYEEQNLVTFSTKQFDFREQKKIVLRPYEYRKNLGIFFGLKGKHRNLTNPYDQKNHWVEERLEQVGKNNCVEDSVITHIKKKKRVSADVKTRWQ